MIVVGVAHTKDAVQVAEQGPAVVCASPNGYTATRYIFVQDVQHTIHYHMTAFSIVPAPDWFPGYMCEITRCGGCGQSLVRQLVIGPFAVKLSCSCFNHYFPTFLSDCEGQSDICSYLKERFGFCDVDQSPSSYQMHPP